MHEYPYEYYRLLSRTYGADITKIPEKYITNDVIIGLLSHDFGDNIRNTKIEKRITKSVILKIMEMAMYFSNKSILKYSKSKGYFTDKEFCISVIKMKKYPNAIKYFPKNYLTKDLKNEYADIDLRTVKYMEPNGILLKYIYKYFHTVSTSIICKMHPNDITFPMYLKALDKGTITSEYIKEEYLTSIDNVIDIYRRSYNIHIDKLPKKDKELALLKMLDNANAYTIISYYPKYKSVFIKSMELLLDTEDGIGRNSYDVYDGCDTYEELSEDECIICALKKFYLPDICLKILDCNMIQYEEIRDVYNSREFCIKLISKALRYINVIPEEYKKDNTFLSVELKYFNQKKISSKYGNALLIHPDQDKFSDINIVYQWIGQK